MQQALEPLLDLRGIVKRFAGTIALNHVGIKVYPGEIHALLGENGAGKSTLIKILSGVYLADQGQITFRGVPVNPASQTLPISFIHQDLGLVDSMTVGENVAIVAGYQRSHGLISWKGVNRRAREILSGMGSAVDPETRVADLSAAERSLVAIARALSVEADLLVLDEPTASLPATDVSHLLDVLRQLKRRGIGIIYVTHRIDEVFRIADTVTVLRDGKHVATMPVTDTNQQDLVFKIVGRDVSEVFVAPPAASLTDQRLEVKGLTAERIGPISFSLAGGEILGLVGLRGAGQETIGRILFGDMPLQQGVIQVDGKRMRPESCLHAIKNGIGYVSSKRMEDNLAGVLSVRENLFLNPEIQRGAKRRIDRKAEMQLSHDLVDRFAVRPPDVERVVTTLSGGNQQKVILARWLALNAKILILEEPTGGVDVGAKAEIYRLLGNEVKAGISILLISSDFEEVSTICHRALVFNRGQIVAEVPGQDLSVQLLTGLATGMDTDQSHMDTGKGRMIRG